MTLVIQRIGNINKQKQAFLETFHENICDKDLQNDIHATAIYMNYVFKGVINKMVSSLIDLIDSEHCHCLCGNGRDIVFDIRFLCFVLDHAAEDRQ